MVQLATIICCSSAYVLIGIELRANQIWLALFNGMIPLPMETKSLDLPTWEVSALATANRIAPHEAFERHELITFKKDKPAARASLFGNAANYCIWITCCDKTNSGIIVLVRHIHGSIRTKGRW